MRNFISAVALTALSVCLVPQAAFGFAKPPITSHPDVAPSIPRATTAQEAVIALGGSADGTNMMSFTALTTGDIVVVLDPSSATGHAGLFDRSRYYSISSYAVVSANVSPANGVQIEKCLKYRMYDRAWGLRVPREYSHRVAVRDYAVRQLGKPYSVLASKTDLRSFYCSKLAWVAYRNVTGVDLDADGGTWVWPVDLLNSSYTSLVGYWT